VSSPSKRKGTQNETHNVVWWRGKGHKAERKAPAGANDQGDIHVDDWFLIEAKDTSRLDLAAGVSELLAELEHSGLEHGAVVFKRKGTLDVGRYYAVMPVELLQRLITR
jgi:hypothetical protein